MPDSRPAWLTRRTVLGASGAVAVGGAAVWTGAVALANPTGSATPAADCDLDPARPKGQFRSFWVSTTVNIDWPSQTGLDAETQKEEYLRFLEDARANKLNAVITQIRPTADAFWPSEHEPWSRWLSGEQGEDPGYDPLQFLVEETHKAGMEFHAWLNPYRISMKASAGDVGTDLDGLHADHPARANPEWVVAYPTSDGQLYYNPGIPEVREFVIEAMMDAVDNYDIDGVHFDDYFYPYPAEGEEFDDDDAFAEHGGDFDDKGDWRRDNTDQLIQEFGKRIKESKPWIKFGVSPFGVWRNKSDDDDGSDTDAGAPTYDVLYADTRKWVQEGWIDYIAPQLYWAISLDVASYKVLVEWWNDVCADTDCQLFIGEATYKVGDADDSPEWKNDPEELTNHLTLCRDLDAVDGNIYFSALSVREDPLDCMTILREEHYTRPALVPAADHLGGNAPAAPEVTSVTHDGEFTVEWKNTSDGEGVDEVKWFAVHAVSGEPDDCSFVDGTNLIAVVPGDPEADIQEYSWEADADPEMRVAVTALNRAWQESEPAIGQVE